MIKFFETVEVTLNRDVEVSDDFVPLDENLFVHSGVFEDSEHGRYELCTVQKGSRVFVSMRPNGTFSMTDCDGSHTSHAQLQLQEFNLPPNINFVKSMKPVPGQTGMFSY
jgi:hypothetical protein